MTTQLEVLHPLDPRTVIITKEVSTEEIKILKRWVSVWGSVWGSVRDSENACVGSLFTNIKKWKYTKKIKVEGYPFQPCVDLFKHGLVPCTDGKKWYLVHPLEGKVGKIKWSGKLD